MDKTGSMGAGTGGQQILRPQPKQQPDHFEQWHQSNTGKLAIGAAATGTGGAVGAKSLELYFGHEADMRVACESAREHLAAYDYNAEEVIGCCEGAQCPEAKILGVLKASGQFPEIDQCVIIDHKLVLKCDGITRPKRLTKRQVFEGQLYSSNRPAVGADLSMGSSSEIGMPPNAFPETGRFGYPSSSGNNPSFGSMTSSFYPKYKQFCSEAPPTPQISQNKYRDAFSADSLYVICVGIFWGSMFFLGAMGVGVLKNIAETKSSPETIKKSLNIPLEFQTPVSGKSESFVVDPNNKNQHFDYLMEILQLEQAYKMKKMEKAQILFTLEKRFDFSKNQSEKIFSRFSTE